MKRKEFIKEINKLDSASLKSKATELAEELMRLRFKKSTRQLEGSHRLQQVRRSLARVSTLLTRKASEAGSSGKSIG